MLNKIILYHASDYPLTSAGSEEECFHIKHCMNVQNIEEDILIYLQHEEWSPLDLACCYFLLSMINLVISHTHKKCTTKFCDSCLTVYNSRSIRKLSIYFSKHKTWVLDKFALNSKWNSQYDLGMWENLVFFLNLVTCFPCYNEQVTHTLLSSFYSIGKAELVILNYFHVIQGANLHSVSRTNMNLLHGLQKSV